MEELDYPGEFFFDKRTEKLYLFHNGLPFEDSSGAYWVQAIWIYVFHVSENLRYLWVNYNDLTTTSP